MSDVSLASAAKAARDSLVQLCWTQWQAMGSPGSRVGSAQADSIIDPEALILLSLYAQRDERRLVDMVAWWASVGSGLTSLHRMQRIGSRFTGSVGADGLQLFSSLAVRSGDRRWRDHASVPVPDWVRAVKGRDEPILIEASALWPRLRAAFGVGAKADTLVFLLGLRGAWASAKLVSSATGYSQVAVRRAAGEMALAHLIRETKGRPVEYFAPTGPWAELLELSSNSEPGSTVGRMPAWRFWSEIGAFLVGVVEWHRLSETDERTGPYVVASGVRELMDRHRLALNFNQIDVPPLETFRGLEILDGLHETVRAVTIWVGDSV